MFIGIDLGTSGLRALLVDDMGQPVGSATHDYAAVHPQSGWSEQDASLWTIALRSALQDLKASHQSAFSDVRGISFSGHMHGAVTLDANGSVLRPCILWNDTRAQAEAAELDATPGLRDVTGNIVFPGFTAPKLLWMKRHEPELFAEVTTVMLPKDYLVFWLTGRRVTDMSDAAGTAWLDVAMREWSDAALQASGMRPDQMPALNEGLGVVGEILPEHDLGLPEGTLVVAGGADNAVAACGVGALAEGQAFVSLGTSGVLLTGRDSCAPAPSAAVHTFCHAVPDRWYQMGVTLAATDSLNWLSRITGKSAEDLSKAAGQMQAPGDLRFYPYISGERTPHNDSVIRGGFTGIDVNHDVGDMARAVMAGVAFSLRDSLEALRSTGVSLNQALAIGGGTRSRLWTEMLATALDLPLQRPAQGEFGAALGAARLAICGVTGALPDDLMTPPTLDDTIDPNPDLRAAYEEAYQSFRAGYSKLKDLQ